VPVEPACAISRVATPPLPVGPLRLATGIGATHWRRPTPPATPCAPARRA